VYDRFDFGREGARELLAACCNVVLTSGNLTECWPAARGRVTDSVNFLVSKLKGRHHLEDLDVDGKVMLKLILIRYECED
jgi:hypothetical protein